MAEAEPGGLAAGPGAQAGGGGTLRASHADRDRVAEALRVAAGDGRLSPEELDERLERALTARTYAELAALTADLPAAPGAGVAPAHAGTLGARAPKDLVRIDVTSGSARRDGPWVVPRQLEVKVTSGNVTLDFTEAVITEPAVRLNAEVGSGNLTIITRPGIAVDMDDVRARSGTVKVRAPWGHDVPAVLRIEVEGSVRSGNIIARPPRRTFWRWLRRAPRRYAVAA